MFTWPDAWLLLRWFYSGGMQMGGEVWEERVLLKSGAQVRSGNV